jgi:hypothetical protein
MFALRRRTLINLTTIFTLQRTRLDFFSCINLRMVLSPLCKKRAQAKIFSLRLGKKTTSYHGHADNAVNVIRGAGEAAGEGLVA